MSGAIVSITTHQGQTQTSDLAWDRRRLRAIYRGDRDETVAAFRERFQGQISSSSGNDYKETSRNILVENELKPLVDQRVEAVPTTFEPESADKTVPEERVERFSGWACSAITPEGWDLYASLQQIVQAQEKDGASVVVAGRRGDRVWLEVRDAVEIDGIRSDPSDPSRLTGWVIGWTRVENGREVSHSETWTETEQIMSVAGKEVSRIVHGLGYLPVVVIPRTMEFGGMISQPGPGELIEAYLAFLWATYLRNIANKYTAFQVWGPADELTASALAGDGNSTGMSTLSVYPGAVVKANITPRGGNINLASLEAQRSDSLRTLRELGRGESDPEERADMRSGKAAVIGGKGLRAYAAQKAILLKIGLERIATLWARLAGEIGPQDEAGIRMLLAKSEQPDPAEAREQGKLWIQANVAGLATVRMVLENFQRLGLIEEDADIDAMVLDVEAKKAESAGAMMELLDKRRAAQPMAEAEDEEDEDEEPEEVAGVG